MNIPKFQKGGIVKEAPKIHDDHPIPLSRKEQKKISEEVDLLNKLQQIDMCDELIQESLERIEIIVKGKLNGKPVD